MFRDLNEDNCFLGNIEVKKSSIHGWGVFATEGIQKYSLVERCPTIMFQSSSINNLEVCEWLGMPVKHVLYDYVFDVDGTGLVCLPWGYGCIYNHGGDDANAFWRVCSESRAMNIFAARNIEKGEEITTRYVPGDLVFDEVGGFYVHDPSHIAKTIGLNPRGDVANAADPTKWEKGSGKPR